MVDDNSDILYTLQIRLESDPTMQVYGFNNSVTALLEFKTNFYDLLLIDVKTSLMDVLQLTH